MHILVYISANLIFVFFGTAFAQDAKLIEAARQEGGKVVVYGSLDSDTGDAIGSAFFKKNGIKMDYWRASSTEAPKSLEGFVKPQYKGLHPRPEPTRRTQSPALRQ